MADIPVDRDIKTVIKRAVEHFKANGLDTKEVVFKSLKKNTQNNILIFWFQAPFESLQNTTETGLAKFFTMEDVPLILRHRDNPKKIDSLFIEMLKSIIGQSKYTFAGLFFVLLYYTHGFIPKSKLPKYTAEFDQLKTQFLASFELFSSI